MNNMQELETKLAEAKVKYQEALKKLRAVPKGKQYLNAYLSALSLVSDTYGVVRSIESKLFDARLKGNGFFK